MKIIHIVETAKCYYYSGKIKSVVKSYLSLYSKWNSFWKDFELFLINNSFENRKKALINLSPELHDKTSETCLDPIYFYQDCWAFELIVKNKPTKHFDIGSHHKYVALLSKVVDVTMVDIRPLSLTLDSLGFVHGDITALPLADRSITSLSSLCVIEHIGLGRYGDAIDAKGSEKAAAELARVLVVGGHLYVSVPVAKESFLRFNSHRVFEENYFLSLFPEMECVEKKYIIDETCGDYRSDLECVGLYHLIKR